MNQWLTKEATLDESLELKSPTKLIKVSRFSTPMTIKPAFKTGLSLKRKTICISQQWPIYWSFRLPQFTQGLTRSLNKDKITLQEVICLIQLFFC